MLCLRHSQRVLSSTWATKRMMSLGSSAPMLPISPLSLEKESAQFNARVEDMEDFFAQPRFNGIKRPYSAASVVAKQGSMPILPLPGTLLADKLFGLLTNSANAGEPVHTMGAIDPVQMTQMAYNQEVVYVSGWAASSVLTTGNNEVGPDLGYISYHFYFPFFTYPRIKRLSIHYCSESSSPDFPCPATS